MTWKWSSIYPLSLFYRKSKSFLIGKVYQGTHHIDGVVILSRRNEYHPKLGHAVTMERGGYIENIFFSLDPGQEQVGKVCQRQEWTFLSFLAFG